MLHIKSIYKPGIDTENFAGKFIKILYYANSDWLMLDKGNGMLCSSEQPLVGRNSTQRAAAKETILCITSKVLERCVLNNIKTRLYDAVNMC